MESSNLYRLRKKHLFERTQEALIPDGRMPYSSRPHRTLPELDEQYPGLWLPEPIPPTVLVCIWDDPDAVWDDTFGFDCEDQ